MRIGFIFDESVNIGGGFQQNLSMILALRELRGHDLLVLTSRADNVERIRKIGLNCELYRFGRVRRALSKLLSRSSRLRRIFKRLPRSIQIRCGSFDAVLDVHQVDLAFCFFLSWVPEFLFHRPFVTVVYDLCHREHCEFPEVSERFEFEKRERIFREILPRAIAVLISSPSLAHQLQLYYGIDKQRLIELPLLPAVHARVRATPDEVRRVRMKYSLPDDYVFYPAQLWPHKNHLYILEAIRILADTWDRRVTAVFTGSDFGNAGYVVEAVRRLGIEDRVCMLGFVDSGDIEALYTGAQALVMPSYFGPTNMPPLEALSIGCPVIYSDVPEFRAVLGNAALYCDLNEPASLAKKIRSVMEQPELAEALKRAGAQVIGHGDNHEYVEIMQMILDRYEYLRRRWLHC